ncbi:hypothetical protein D3C84_980880 [compost metagenome]
MLIRATQNSRMVFGMVIAITTTAASAETQPSAPSLYSAIPPAAVSGPGSDMMATRIGTPRLSLVVSLKGRPQQHSQLDAMGVARPKTKKPRTRTRLKIWSIPRRVKSVHILNLLGVGYKKARHYGRASKGVTLHSQQFTLL